MKLENMKDVGNPGAIVGEQTKKNDRVNIDNINKSYYLHSSSLNGIGNLESNNNYGGKIQGIDRRFNSLSEFIESDYCKNN